MKYSPILPPLSPLSKAALAAILTTVVAATARATILDDIGVTALRAQDASLIGTGVNVVQAEAPIASDPNNPFGSSFEINPVAANSGGAQTVPITYIANATSNNIATVFPNSVGLESSHADSVGANFFGVNTGPAKGVARVYNYDANKFVSDVFSLTPMAPTVVNQSFVFNVSNTASSAAVILQLYDNFVATYSTTIVTAVGNTLNTLSVPSTAYNVISVAAVPIPGDPVFASGSGPSIDGRSKPDIAAYGEATSYATPLVSGVAAVLYQAGARGDGGAGTSTTAVDSMVIKALLLNGATKTVGWTHSSTAPLSTVSGAGIVNALSSYNNLHAGTYAPTSTTSIALNSASHAGITSGTAVGVEGWVRRSNLTTDDTHDSVDHFLIDLTTGGSLFTLNATLTWNREFNQAIAQNTPNAVVSTINNLDMFLYNGSTLVASSISGVDNVEHFASLVLPPAKYDLQIMKHGGPFGNSNVNNDTSSYFTETYGLAWNASTINTAGSTITSPNSFFEFSTSRSVSGITGVNAVQVDSGATLTLGVLAAASVNNNGTTVFNNTTTQIVSSDISGTGGITQSGTGTSILTGNNTYLGTTTISAGKLQIGNAGTAGVLGTGPVVNNSNLTFNRSDAILVANNITGSGSLTQAGSGSVTLTQNLTLGGGLTISAGKLAVTADGATHSAVALNIGTLTITGGKLDLQDRDAIIHNPGGNFNDDTAITTLGNLIHSGLLGGSGVTSSAALAAGNTTLGFGYAHDFGISVFDGVSVNPADMLIRYVGKGDANFDGQTDAADLDKIFRNLGGLYSGAYFGGGDLNGDGQVDAADLDQVFQDLGNLVGGDYTPLSLGVAAVPEPASLALLALGGLALCRRSRSRRA